MGLLAPFGAKASFKPISSKDEARPHQLGKQVSFFFFFEIFTGSVLRAERGWSCDFLLADCEEPENLSASGIHVKRFKHQRVTQEEKLLFPCTDECLKLFDLDQPPGGEMPASGNAQQDEKRTLCEEGDGKYVFGHEWRLPISDVKKKRTRSHPPEGHCWVVGTGAPHLRGAFVSGDP